AKIISYKSQTIRKWLCQDKLPEGLPRPKQINGRHYWLRKDVLDFIDTFSVRESL
ncbi:DNA-binding protein, partial [Escherichia coli]|nr:DNA-binding protein [Escherichia coli]EGK5125519.1 DNA-binding protein [Escherichia coli]EGK5187567.1 DNA-binding protein [Escherichia coli]EGK6259929.1 DNA-binding protein [Escherichia coli]HAZ8097991.1 DNA-binding protein [Escherichia coli]